MKPAVLIVAIFLSIGGYSSAQSTPPASATSPTSPATDPARAAVTPANPPAARRTYPGLRTLPGQTVPNAPATAATPGQLVTNAAVGTPLTNNAPVIRVPPIALPGATNAVASGRSNVTPLQLENINRLDVALNALRLPSRDPSAQQQALLEILRAAPVSANKATPDLVDRLGTRLAEVFPTLNLTAQQRRQLAIDINMAMNSGNLSSLEAQRVLADARSLLQASAAANRQGVDDLVQSLSSVISNIQSNTAQKNGTTATDSQSNTSTPTTGRPAEAGQSPGPQTGTGTGTDSGVQPEPAPTPAPR